MHQINKFLYILLFVMINNIGYAKVFSWRYNNIPSLLLTDKVGVIESNNALMMNTNDNKHMIRIEDIITQTGNYFSYIFVNFDKKYFTSFVTVKMYDTFTDELIAKFQFDESGSAFLDNKGAKSDRIYLVAEINGKDVELRVVGVEIYPSIIAEINDLSISSQKIYQQKDILNINLNLQEAAAIFLYIYNKEGDICSRITSDTILDAGEYKFVWNPRSIQNQMMGNSYYLWFKATNLRSKTIEYVREFYMIP